MLLQQMLNGGLKHNSMIRFKENPDLKLKRVKTISGQTEYKKNCINIGDAWYIKGEDCVQIGEKWYTKNSKLITFDYEKQKWVLIKDSTLIYGVVGFRKSDNTPIFGYFTENKCSNLMVKGPNYDSDVK